MDWPGLIRELKHGGWKLFAVLLVVSLAVSFAPVVFPTTFPEPIPGVSATARLIALGSFLVLACYAVGWAASKLSARPGARAVSPRRLRRRYASLNAEQLNLLHSVLKTGKRGFPWDGGTPRWFEELNELGFVSFVNTMVYWAGDPLNYELTVPAWTMLEELNREGRLR